MLERSLLLLAPREPTRAIIHDTWTLEREFEIEQDREFYFAVLDCEGLDTFATVFVNDIEIAHTENQFRRYLFDVANVLKHGRNTIRIRLDDATRIAADKAEKYPYYVPDMFNISGAQHGFPHRNMIRKEQVSHQRPHKVKNSANYQLTVPLSIIGIVLILLGLGPGVRSVWYLAANFSQTGSGRPLAVKVVDWHLVSRGQENVVYRGKDSAH